MIHTEMTRRAARLAYDAHHGQLDDGGMPYVFHPFHLAERMPDEATTCAALLHDVVEHTDATFDDLAGFPDEVVEAVRLLTHGEGVPYMDYVRGLSGNRIARTVKLADLEHNSDMSRFRGAEGVTEGMMSEWSARYAEARRFLEGCSEDRRSSSGLRFLKRV